MGFARPGDRQGSRIGPDISPANVFSQEIGPGNPRMRVLQDPTAANRTLVRL